MTIPQEFDFSINADTQALNLYELEEKYVIRSSLLFGAITFSLSPKADMGRRYCSTGFDTRLKEAIVASANLRFLDHPRVQKKWGDLNEATKGLEPLIHHPKFRKFAKLVPFSEHYVTRINRCFRSLLILGINKASIKKGAIILSEKYWLESIIPSHPYGADVYIDLLPIWRKSQTSHTSFKAWLESKPKLGTSRVKYYNQLEMQDYQVSFEEGRLYQKGKPLDTHDIFTEKSEHCAIYVISLDSKMYVGPYKTGQLHHSSFFNGQPVLGAGEIQTDKEGNICMLSSKSGHYKPRAKQLFTTLTFLAAQGCDLDKIVLIENHQSGLIRHSSVEDFMDATIS